MLMTNVGDQIHSKLAFISIFAESDRSNRRLENAFDYTSKFTKTSMVPSSTVFVKNLKNEHVVLSPTSAWFTTRRLSSVVDFSEFNVPGGKSG